MVSQVRWDNGERVSHDDTSATVFSSGASAIIRFRARLEKELSQGHIGNLNQSFADLVAAGEIVKAAPLPQEQDEPNLLSKPRISFRNNKQSAGRLNEMILAINDMGITI